MRAEDVAVYEALRERAIGDYPPDSPELRAELARLARDFEDKQIEALRNWTEPDIQGFGKPLRDAWAAFWDLQPDRPTVASLGGVFRDRIPYVAWSQWLVDHGYAVDSEVGIVIRTLISAMEAEAAEWENRKKASADLDKESETDT